MGRISVRAELRLQGYELGERVHSGGQGVVYRATDTETGEAVAIKFPLRRYGRSQTERFRAEIDDTRRAQAGQSDHVVRMIDSGEAVLPYLVLEYLPTTLRHLLDRHTRLGAGGLPDRLRGRLGRSEHPQTNWWPLLRH